MTNASVINLPGADLDVSDIRDLDRREMAEEMLWAGRLRVVTTRMLGRDDESRTLGWWVSLRRQCGASPAAFFREEAHARAWASVWAAQAQAFAPGCVACENA